MHERIARHQWFETIQEVYVSCAVPLSDHLLLPLHYILISLITFVQTAELEQAGQ